MNYYDSSFMVYRIEIPETNIPLKAGDCVPLSYTSHLCKSLLAILNSRRTYQP